MIITLCGSARFEKWFHSWNEVLSLSGHCVFGLGSYPSFHEGEKNWYSPEQKNVLDAVHKWKINLSEAILVLNPFAYLGESTLSEIRHATVKKKQIYYLQSWGEGCGVGANHFKHVLVEKTRFGVAKDYVSPISTVPRDRSPWDLLPPQAGPFRSELVERLKEKGVD